MHRSIARLKGMGYVIWHGKHMVIHVLLGFMWAWVMREVWNEFNPRWIVLSVFGSLIPDIDHFVYFFTYGKRDPYTRTVVTFFKNKEWRVLTKFLEKGHKYNTNLSFHNFYISGALCIMCVLSYLYDWRTGTILFGAITTHFVFDIVEDVLLLGRVNTNWRRWGRARL